MTGKILEIEGGQSVSAGGTVTVEWWKTEKKKHAICSGVVKPHGKKKQKVPAALLIRNLSHKHTHAA